MATKSWSDSPGKLFLVAAVIFGVVASSVVWWSNRQVAGVEQAHFSGPGRVVLVRRPAAIFGSEHLAELVEVDTSTGQIVARVDDAGGRMFPLRVVAPPGGHVWFFSGPTDVWSRPLTAITERHASGAGVATHAELYAGFELRWLHPDGVIVQGRASNEFLVRADGAIEKTDWTLNTMRYAHWRYDALDADAALPRGHTSVRGADGAELTAKDLPLEGAHMVEAVGDRALLVASPPGALAIGGDLAVPQGSPRVDRLALVTGSEAAWSVSAADLFGEPDRFELWGAILGVRVLAVQVVDAGIEVVLRARSRRGVDELRFVLLDPVTGKALRTTSLVAGG